MLLSFRVNKAQREVYRDSVFEPDFGPSEDECIWASGPTKPSSSDKGSSVALRRSILSIGMLLQKLGFGGGCAAFPTCFYVYSGCYLSFQYFCLPLTARAS